MNSNCWSWNIIFCVGAPIDIILGVHTGVRSTIESSRLWRLFKQFTVMLETNPVFLYLQMYVVLQISICNADKKFKLKDGLANNKQKKDKEILQIYFWNVY